MFNQSHSASRARVAALVVALLAGVSLVAVAAETKAGALERFETATTRVVFSRPLVQTESWQTVTVETGKMPGFREQTQVRYRNPGGTLAEFDPPLDMGEKVRFAYTRDTDLAILFKDADKPWDPKNVQRIATSLDYMPTGFFRQVGPILARRQGDAHLGPLPMKNAAAYACPWIGRGLWIADGTFAGSNIDPWMGPDLAEYATITPEAIFVHELGHMADYNGRHRKLANKDDTDFKGISWRRVPVLNVKRPESQGTFVSDYASTQPAEDFAESIAAYVFHPKQLQKASPEKYDYIKKYVFDDWEAKDQFGPLKPMYPVRRPAPRKVEASVNAPAGPVTTAMPPRTTETPAAPEQPSRGPGILDLLEDIERQ